MLLPVLDFYSVNAIVHETYVNSLVPRWINLKLKGAMH